MPQALPIACSLSAADLTARLAQMGALGRDALLGVHHDGRRAQLRFAAGAGVRERIDEVVTAESRCCAFLTMDVSRDADTVVLTIETPEGAEVVLAEIVQAFEAGHASA